MGIMKTNSTARIVIENRKLKRELTISLRIVLAEKYDQKTHWNLMEMGIIKANSTARNVIENRYFKLELPRSLWIVLAEKYDEKTH